MLNGEKLKAFLLRSGTRQGCPLSPLLFNIILQALVMEAREEIKKRNPIGKEHVKLSLFAGYIILNIENTKGTTRKLLELKNLLGKFSGYKTNTQKSVAFLYNNSKRLEKITSYLIN